MMLRKKADVALSFRYESSRRGRIGWANAGDGGARSAASAPLSALNRLCGWMQQRDLQAPVGSGGGGGQVVAHTNRRAIDGCS